MKLAINGGPAEAAGLQSLVPPWPHATEKDRRALLEVLDSGRWCRVGASKGEVSKVDAFDEAFAKFQDAKYGISVANGTVSLELALKAMGVGYGDEVIVPAMTFIASATCATEVGAIPVLVDCEYDTGAPSAASIEAAITEKTKAIILPHYHGYPPDFDAILPIARRNGLLVLEDAATAVGTEWNGKRVGALGDMGSFSFQQAKLITAGEGGIVLTNNGDLAEKGRLIQNIGRVYGPLVNDFLLTSSNYRMTEFQGALLLSMLEDLPPKLEHKHRSGEYLADKVEKIDGIKTQKRDPRVKFCYYKFIMRYDPEAFGGVGREKFVAALRAEGVGVDQKLAKLIYKQTAFTREALAASMPTEFRMPDYPSMFLPNSERLVTQEVMLPHTWLAVEREGLDMVVAAIEKIKSNIDELKVAPSVTR